MKKKVTSLAIALLLALSLCIPAMAAELDHVTDAVEALDEGTLQEYNALAGNISDYYGCGIYAVLVDDYANYGNGDVSDVAGQIYHEYDLGVGEGYDGVLLLLSMAERDYSIYVFGETAEYAFGSYARDKLADKFLGAFGENDWAGGMYDYIVACGEFLDSAANGSPVKESVVSSVAIWGAVSCLVAGIVCLILKGKMKTVHKGASAAKYVAAGGLVLTGSYDNFTHTTVTRSKIEKESSSGSSGGGSSSSGKF